MRLAAVLLICAAVATMMIISPWMVRERKKHRAARDAENRLPVQDFELDHRKTFGACLHLSKPNLSPLASLFSTKTILYVLVTDPRGGAAGS